MVRKWLAVVGAAVLLVLTCGGGQVARGERASTESNGILAGRVAQTGRDHVLVQLPGGPAVSLRVGAETRVLVGGELISPRQLMPGTDVRVTYQLQGGKPVADWIEVTTPEAY